MKSILIWALTLFLSFGSAFAETVDQAVERVLAGDKLTQQEIDAITDKTEKGPEINGQRNNGTTYLHLVKRSIVDSVKDGNLPITAECVDHERGQAKTYRELKAIYEKQKTPLLAYALVCPAMSVNDFDFLPELIAKIGENKFLKHRFDFFYNKRWKPYFDPDF